MPDLLPLSFGIDYLIPVEDGSPEQASMLQGFAPSLIQHPELLRFVAFQPASIHDLAPDGASTLLARKIGGADPFRWHPQSPKALTSMVIPPQHPFVVLLLSSDHDYGRYRPWIEAQSFPILVLGDKPPAQDYRTFTFEIMRTHFLKVCDAIEGKVLAESLAAARATLESWQAAPRKELGYQVKGHNSVTPNLIALLTAGYQDTVSGRFDEIGPEVGLVPYVKQIVRTAETIFDEREAVGKREAHRTFLCPPDLNLFAPAIYPHVLQARTIGDPALASIAVGVRDAQRLLKTQKGYKYEVSGRKIKSLFQDAVGNFRPHPLIAERAMELSFGTECVALLAGSEFSATLRLPNEINTTAGAVRQFATHYRSHEQRDRKRLSAFRRVQKAISAAVPREFEPLIARSEHGVRIIADAHLEWLNIGGLPLSIAKNTSRVPVTPGNLFTQIVRPVEFLHLTTDALREILVLNALKRADPISGLFRQAFEVFGKEWGDRISLRSVDIRSEDDLVRALNDFGGAMVVYDGHGSHAPGGAGVLHLGGSQVDVWKLFGRVQRPPPVVILSACDTHAADRNHATVGNGFLSLGVRSVLSSVFPLDARDAAVFTARLLYRISHFVPAAFRQFERSLSWLEITSGLLRMQLLTDFLRRLIRKKRIDEAQYESIHTRGNLAINAGAELAFDIVIRLLIEEAGLDELESRQELEMAIANSSTLACVQLGRPESILVHAADAEVHSSGETFHG